MKKHDKLQSTNPAEIEALIERVEGGPLCEGDAQLVGRLLRLMLVLLRLIEGKNASIARLKRLLFGPRSDKRSVTEPKSETAPAQESALTVSTVPEESLRGNLRSGRRGHGRLRAAAYTGARVVACQDPALQPGDSCPDRLCSGHLYDTRKPAVLIQLTGQPLVGATRYEQQVLRCSACQHRYTASLPAGVRPEKFDASADVALALSKYAAGLPFHRLARVQAAFGVPLPASVQFARCEAVADAALPVFRHLRQLAAQGQVLYADDTKVQILSCAKENQQLSEGERRGLYTTGIVAQVEGQRIALYQSGRRHAGENLTQLLGQRPTGLPPPIQMADALASNWSGEFATIVSKCLAHARRQFVELEAAFPQECARVLEDLAKVYRAEAETRQLTAPERLAYHQRESGPVMAELRAWIDKQLSQQQVEPNSSLGRALRYLQNHWAGLTQFLRTAGAPLDNNIVERALKLAVLVRKNSLFYKTEHGAAVGDILLSLIETCRLADTSAWDYLLALVRNARAARQNPPNWLPWNYTLAASQAQAA